MAEVKPNENVDGPIEPVESPQTEIARITDVGDPDIMLAILKRKAELASQFREAQNTILATQTYPQDWHKFGEGDNATVCLSSAGAERVGRLFDIKFFEVKHQKEEFTDAHGKGFRYTFEGKACMGNSVVWAQGVYGSRDKFLGYAKGEYKPIEDVAENHIRNAAYHIFMGNAIKSLLGLRNLPASEFEHLMNRTGQDATKAGSHRYASGSKGGTSADDSGKQKELVETCLAIANAGQRIEFNAESNKCELKDISELDDRPVLEITKETCVALSTFKGKDGVVAGKDAKGLAGKRLEIALNKAKEIWKG